MSSTPTRRIKQNQKQATAAAAGVENNNNGRVEADDKTRLEQIIKDNDQKYPQSHLYHVGHQFIQDDQVLSAIEAFKRGSSELGCVPCIIQYIFCLMALHQEGQGNCHTPIIHLAVPLLLEGAIRGNVWCMQKLYVAGYYHAKPVKAEAISDYWLKRWEGDFLSIKQRRRTAKQRTSAMCVVCHLTDFDADSEDNDVTLVKCGKCKYYSYCGKNCQTRHWKEYKHMNECRHLCLLHKYHKPYATEIREAIQHGTDPTTIPRLQTLRTKLGLNRPRGDYAALLAALSVEDNDDDNHDHDTDDNNNNNNNNTNNRLNQYHYIVARKDGTVHIGSTPEAI